MGQLIINRTPLNVGRPRIRQRAVLTGFSDAPRLVTIAAEDGPVQGMRVYSDDGAEIALPVEGVAPEELDYTDTVLIEEPIEDGNTTSVWVRATGDVDDEDPNARRSHITAISDSNQTTSVGVSDAPLRADSAPPAVAPPLAGTYRGFARLVDSGLVDGVVPRVQPGANVSTRLSAQVFPASGGLAVIVIDDALRLLVPRGRWAGEVRLEDQRVELPDMELYAAENVVGAPVQAVAVVADGALDADISAPDWNGSLVFRLELYVTGVAGRASAPRQLWTVALERVGDLPDDAGAPSADAAAMLDPAVIAGAGTPLPREAAFLDSVRDRDGFGRREVSNPDARCTSSSCADDEYCPFERQFPTCFKKIELRPEFVNAWRRGPRAERTPPSVCTDPRDAVPAAEATDGPDGRLSLCGGNVACVLFEKFASEAVGGFGPLHTSTRAFTAFTRVEDRLNRLNLVGLMANWVAPTGSISFRGNTMTASDDFEVLDEYGPPPAYADFKRGGGALSTPIMRSLVDALTVTTGAAVDAPRVVGMTAQLGDLSAVAERPMWTLGDGSTLDFAVPCAFDLSGLAFTPIEAPEEGYGLTVDSEQLELDACAALTVSHECTVVDIRAAVDVADRTVFDSESGPFGQATQGVAGVGLTLYVIDPEYFGPDGEGTTATTLTTLATGRTLVDKVCVFPTQPSACAEASLCERAVDAYDNPTVDPLAPAIDPISGDLSCTASGLGLVQPMDGAQRSIGEMRALCRADLNALNGTPDAVPGGACIDPDRFVAQLAIAGEVARTQGTRDPTRPPVLADHVFVRLLQRYLQTAEFTIDDAVSGGALDADAESGGVSRGQAVLEAALAESLNDWNLLLVPRIGAALTGLPSAVIADPDYRTQLLGDRPELNPQYTQTRGLPVAMLSLLATQMDLMAEIADRQLRSGDPDFPDVIARGLMVAGLVEAHVNGLVTRAAANAEAQPLRWLRMLPIARNRFDTARTTVLTRLNAIEQGTNPLGIEDDDLPLYFREIDNDAANYTAISQFILGTEALDSGVAINAVRRARAAEELARDSRRAEAMRQINEENNNADRDLDVLENRRALGETVEDLCGATFFEAMSPEAIADLLEAAPTELAPAGGLIDFSRCWFRSELTECATDGGLRAAQDDQDTVDDALVRADLIETVEANMRNDLCVATLTASTVDVGPDDPDYQKVLTFTRRDIGEVFGREEELEAVIWNATGGRRVVGVGCWPQRGEGTRQTAGSKALRAVEATLLDPEGPYRATLPAIEARYSPANSYQITSRWDSLGDRCAENVATSEFRIVPYLGEAANLCGGVGPGGLFPDVRFEPADGEGEGEDRFILTCTPPLGGPAFEIEVANTDMGIDALAESTAVTEARATCDRLYPRKFPRLTTERRAFEVTKAICFRGDLGAQAADLRTLAGEVEEAQYELADLLDTYALEKRSCFIQQAGNERLREAAQQFTNEIAVIRKAKLAADILAVAAGEVKDCLSTAVGVVDPANPIGTKANSVFLAGACAAGTASAVLQGASLGLEAEMAALEDQHALSVAALEDATEDKVCFNEAELARVAQRTFELRIQIATQKLESGYTAFTTAVEQAESQVNRGIASIATARVNGASTVEADPLIGRDQVRAAATLRLARRATYLAVRAVEYELQQTLGDPRGLVIAATNADVLQGVINTLRSFVNTTGGPNGARPALLTEVFSLRRHLLQLAPTPVAADPGEHAFTEEQRFRMMLQDPRFEVFEDGEFIGREIPFTIAPLGANDGVRVPIIYNNSCGERLWSVNMSVVGDTARTFVGASPQATLELRQRNTFFANWCDGRPGYQVASTRPSKNLFREPGVADGQELGGGDEINGMADARVQARLDVDPGEFISADYVDGASEELAGRLLFGEYTLFIPAGSIAELDDAGRAIPNTSGLLLGGLEDIAIRFDYLSVARN